MKRMPKKMKLMPLFQELRGRAEISNRRPTVTGSGICLMQLRVNNIAAMLPRRRLVVSVKLDDTAFLPHPVKITHASSESRSPSTGAQPG
jgi:hypothetical protein